MAGYAALCYQFTANYEEYISQQLATLIYGYLDTERLFRENPSVTRETIDAFLQKSVPFKRKWEDTSVVHPQRPPMRMTGLRNPMNSSSIPTAHQEEILGKAGIGVAIFDKGYNLIEEVCSFIGNATNNVAEYKAMILATKKAIDHNAKNVLFKTDSELLVRQLNGVYRVKTQTSSLFTRHLQPS